MKYSATPKATATINHAIHGMKAASRPKRYLEGTSPECRQHTTRARNHESCCWWATLDLDCVEQVAAFEQTRFEQNAPAVASAMKQVVAATEPLSSTLRRVAPGTNRTPAERPCGRSIPALIAGRAGGDLW